MLARLLPLVQKGVFKTAEGIGSVFTRKTPQALGHAFSGLKGAGLRGTAKIGDAFKGIGQGVQHGVYNTAESIGKVFGQDPRKTFQEFQSSDLRGGYRVQGQPSPLGRARTALGNYFKNYGPHLQNMRQQAGIIGQNAKQRLGGLFGGAVGRGASAIGAGAAGLAGMGMAGAGAVGGVAAAPFKAVAGIFAKLGAGTGPVGHSLSLFTKLAGPAGLVGMIFGMKKFVGVLSESNRDLAKWNGSLAASFNKLDIQQMKFDMQTANATSGSASALNDAFAELLTEFQPIRQDIGILVNLAGIGIANGTKQLIILVKSLQDTFPFLKDAVAHLEAMEDELKNGKQQSPIGNTALANLAAMGGGAARPAVQGPMPFLNPGIAPALTPAQKRVLMRQWMGGP